jgi:hypothetical protein
MACYWRFVALYGVILVTLIQFGVAIYVIALLLACVFIHSAMKDRDL